MREMRKVYDTHGIKSGKYRQLKAEWELEVNKEYNLLRAVTTREQRERLLDSDYKGKIETLREIFNDRV